MIPPSVSKKARQANMVPVWGRGVEGKREKAELQNNKQNNTENCKCGGAAW